jgi:WD40 repeat protein
MERGGRGRWLGISLGVAGAALAATVTLAWVGAAGGRAALGAAWDALGLGASPSGAPGAVVAQAGPRGSQPGATVTAEVLHRLKHPYAVFSLAWSPDGAQLAAGGILHKDVHVWDPRAGRLIRVLSDRPGSVQALAYTPDGRYLVAGRGFTATDKDRIALDVWDARTGALVRSIPGPSAVPGANDVRAIAVSPDGRHLAASYQRATLVYDIAHAWSGRTLPGRGFARALAYSRDGRQLAEGEIDGVIRLWDSNTGALVREISAHAGVVEALAYAPRNDGLVSSTDTGTERGELDRASGQFVRRRNQDPIRLWEPATGRLSGEFRGHTGLVSGLAYMPDGRYLVSSSRDRTVRIWDTATGRALAVLRGHPALIHALAMSPDGALFASGGDDVVVVWRGKDLAR